MTDVSILAETHEAPSQERFDIAVRDALLRGGWLAGSVEVLEAQHRAESIGGALAERLREACGASLWDEGIESMGDGSSAPNLRRMLGVGYCLAEYVSAPVSGTDERVASLGALANLVVALYDHCIDDLGLEPALISRHELQTILATAGLASRWIGRQRAVPARLLLRLVGVYARDAWSLAGWRPEGRAANRELARLIIIMHGVEVASRTPTRFPELDLCQKSELPIVVMGEGAWLLRTTSVPTWGREDHLAWVARVGRLIGWVDDAVDLEDDTRRGHDSLLIARMRRRRVTPQGLAHYLTMMLQSIERDWNLAVAACGMSVSAEASAGLIAALASWLAHLEIGQSGSEGAA